MHAQTSHHQIVIVDGGSGGLTVAARLKHTLRRPDIVIGGHHAPTIINPCGPWSGRVSSTKK
jgi:hypothetical protein